MIYSLPMEELFNANGWKFTLETAPLPDGRTKKGVRIHRVDSVHVIAFKTPTTILMTRQFRPFYQDYVWELPGGKADHDGDIEASARQELREEGGMDARSFEYFCNSNLTDSITITNHVFIARDLFESPLPQDAEELIEVHEMTIDEALEKVLNSPKVHLISAYALLRYAREKM